MGGRGLTLLLQDCLYIYRLLISTSQLYQIAWYEPLAFYVDTGSYGLPITYQPTARSLSLLFGKAALGRTLQTTTEVQRLRSTVAHCDQFSLCFLSKVLSPCTYLPPILPFNGFISVKLLLHLVHFSKLIFFQIVIDEHLLQPKLSLELNLYLMRALCSGYFLVT